MSEMSPQRSATKTVVDKATDRYRWALTGPAGVAELVALDVLPLGRAYNERMALHSPLAFPDAELHGQCPVLAGEAHCTGYDLLGDKLVRAWNDSRDEAPIWAQLTELYNVLAVRS